MCTWQKDMQVRLLVGGMSRASQIKDWNRGRKDIVVATPGRLRDLLSEPTFVHGFKHTDMLILDEADTLLDMGFANDLNFIIDHLPKERQTFLFSATVSKEIAAIAKKSLKPNHSVIDCVPKNETNTHLHIPQFYTELDSPADQLPHLLRLITHDQLTHPNSKIVVFLPTTKQTMLFATLLRELSATLPNRLAVHEIHSRLDQTQRSRASERFRKDTKPSVLVTSDVSARGVDYPNVTRVIQVGVPSSGDQYIHRVGRTGRGGREGGRGDLILLPFERKFVHALPGVPIKPVTVAEHAAETAKLAEASDVLDAGDKLKSIQEKVDSLIPALDSAAIEEVYTSLLGYYLSRSSVLGKSSQEILQGLEAWTVESVGLPRPPYLSPGFLNKLGLSKPASSNRGSFGGRGGRPSRGGFGGRNNSYGGRDTRNFRDSRDSRDSRVSRDDSSWPARSSNDSANRFNGRDRGY